MAATLKLVFLSAISLSCAFPFHHGGIINGEHEGIISNLFHLPLRVVGSFLDIGEDFVGSGLNNHVGHIGSGHGGSIVQTTNAVPVAHLGLVPAQGIVHTGILASPGSLIPDSGVFGSNAGNSQTGYPAVNSVLGGPLINQALLHPYPATNVAGNSYGSGAIPAVNAVPAVGSNSFSNAGSSSRSSAGNYNSGGENGAATASASASATAKSVN